MKETRLPSGHVISYFQPAGPLLAEHEQVLAWINAATASYPGNPASADVELKALPAGRALLEADAPLARRYVMAAVEQVRHWDREANRLRGTAKNEIERMNAHLLAGWDVVWGHRRQAAAAVTALMRRSLPLTEEDLLTILDWCDEQQMTISYWVPLSSIVKAAKRYLDGSMPGPAMRESLSRFATKLEGGDKAARRLAVDVQQLGAVSIPLASIATQTSAVVRPVVPAPAGDVGVHQQLKYLLGVRDTPPTATEEPFGPDRYIPSADSALLAEHRMIGDALDTFAQEARNSYRGEYPGLPPGSPMLAANDATRGRIYLAATERIVAHRLDSPDYADPQYANPHGLPDEPPSWLTPQLMAQFFQGRVRAISLEIAKALSSTNAVLDRNGLFDHLLFNAAVGRPGGGIDVTLHEALVPIEQHAATSSLTDGERYVLHLLRSAVITNPPLGTPNDQIMNLTRLIGDGINLWLAPGEAWSDAANADITALAPAFQQAWTALFRHMLTATSARPSGKWLKTGGTLVDAIGRSAVSGSVERWLPLVSRPNTVRRHSTYAGDRSNGDAMNDQNATALRGLIWLVPTLGTPSLTHLLSGVALSGYKKLPGIGFRSPKVGNAAIYALSCLSTEDAIGQLAVLKSRLKGGVQKEIEKAFDATAARLGLPRDRIEEMAVPTYGLTEVGRCVETFGDYSAELRVDGSNVQTTWIDAKGNALKSVPAKVKADHKDTFKELQQAAKDIAAMLPAQRDRIDSLFLTQTTWPAATWRNDYLDHPLVGTIARRLIWTVSSRGQTTPAIWLDGTLVNVDDQPVDVPDDATVVLWHPIGLPMDDVLAWRAWLNRHQVRQPFKQAHREIYPLTDAERRTNTYSNRFAAHVLRQHQFNALCAARHWKNKLRMMVDDVYPPATRDLPQWGLRAEFWIEGIGDNHGTDTNDAGAYLRVATDQVRFYSANAARTSAHASGGGYEMDAAGGGANNLNTTLPLEQVPPLVLSEVLRDVDLFVGVASVGNDPNWQDGGPDGRFRTYWQSYSFGDLSETAKTRRDVLANLLPRLTKLRDRWSLDEKFLVIRGQKRTYKIHLGSGNILMEPNDQYLCIVADRSTATAENVFLPFEGDGTLSIILSKAFLLAEDDK
ncbi:MAG: hypothetical protein JWM57_2069, partial [Phycisphaerales bacterium]|nr:hypothetical protein [Phycisphaerales bacterium]